MALAEQLQATTVLSSVPLLVLLLTVTSRLQHSVLGEGHSVLQHGEAASTEWYFWNEVSLVLPALFRIPSFHVVKL